jgi:hypothetical protein
MPKTPNARLRDRFNIEASDQDDPPVVGTLEQLRAKLARHNEDAAQLAEAMRRKPKGN